MNKNAQTGQPSLGLAFRALAASECRALQRMLAMRGDRQKAIHEARKSCRRLRAMLPFLPSEQPTEAIDQALRAMMHGLAPQRDAHIAARTAQQLATRHATRITPKVIEALETHAVQVLDEALRDDPDWQHRRVQANRIIDTLEVLPWQDIRPAAVKKSLKKTARKMDKAQAQALAERTPEASHRWRRRTRKFRYQLELVRKARRMAGMKKRRTKHYGDWAKRLSNTTDQLGWRQDVQIFLQTIEQLPDSSNVHALRQELESSVESWPNADTQA
jgi:hypothetical protein